MVALPASLYDDCRKRVVVYRDTSASQDQGLHSMVQGFDNYNREEVCVFKDVNEDHESEAKAEK